MSDRKFVDTNVLVYLFDNDEPNKQARAREVLAEEGGAGRLVLSTQVLQEFYVTVTRKLGVPLSPQAALEATKRLTQFHIVHPDSQMVLDAIALCQQKTVSLWDALILQAALNGGCTHLLTEDLHDGWVLDGLRVENPFKEPGQKKS